MNLKPVYRQYTIAAVLLLFAIIIVNAQTEVHFDKTILETEKWEIRWRFKDEIAISHTRFDVGRPQRSMITFYKHIDYYQNKKLTVVATSKNLGDKITLADAQDMTIFRAMEPEKTMLPVMLNFPYEDIWLLDLFVDETKVGDIVVQSN